MDQAHRFSYYHYLFLAAILLLPLLAARIRARKAGKNLPPGPWQLPVIGSLHHLVGSLPHRAMRDQARRHGPLMLLHLGELPVVVASSPDAAREVMRTHDAAFATRPRTATIRELTRDGTGIAFAPHGERWRELRKLCVTELLSVRRVRCLRRGREAEAANLVASLAKKSPSEPVNVSSLLATYVTDVIVRAVVGDRIRDRDAFLERLEEGVKMAAGFSLADVFPSSWLARAFSSAARRAEAHCRAMTLLMNGVIEEHRERRAAAGDGSGNEEEDLLDVLLRIQKDGGLQLPLDMCTLKDMAVYSSRTVWSVGSVQRWERDHGDDAAVGRGGADPAPGGASQGAGRGATRVRRAEPCTRRRAPRGALPPSGHQGNAAAARRGAAAPPAGVPVGPVVPRPRVRCAQGRHGSGQRVGDRPRRRELGPRRRGVQAGAVRSGWRQCRRGLQGHGL